MRAQRLKLLPVLVRTTQCQQLGTIGNVKSKCKRVLFHLLNKLLQKSLVGVTAKRQKNYHTESKSRYFGNIPNEYNIRIENCPGYSEEIYHLEHKI